MISFPDSKVYKEPIVIYLKESKMNEKDPGNKITNRIVELKSFECRTPHELALLISKVEEYNPLKIGNLSAPPHLSIETQLSMEILDRLFTQDSK